MMNAIPKLDPTCNSWVCTSPAGKVVELFTRFNVEKAAAAGWRIETSGAYLNRINVELRSPTNGK